ncbi:hypothetical protein Lspi_1666 [Legionella spiritensis]|uniref:Uncharacterized protein n=2 Tax=Legionella spiritensis TaxID=452 RepID=A0A0W0Z2V7_LEGSP|nr:hypothetical protein Lspi_1666 [Legionella spiritensis]SNV36205.1 Uncharacterised protein [Legionella spiritensis]
MNQQNMDKLVNYLSKFIKNVRSDCSMYNPTNIQYSFYYTNIFLDESEQIGSFCDELVRRLIIDKQIVGLDTSDKSYDPNSPQQKRYEIFYNTWYSWNILYDALQKNGKIKP